MAGAIVPPTLIALVRAIRWLWHLILWPRSLVRLLLPRNLTEKLRKRAGWVAAAGFAFAFGTFLWQDVIIDEAKTSAEALSRAYIDCLLLAQMDQIVETVQPGNVNENETKEFLRQMGRLELLFAAIPDSPEKKSLLDQIRDWLRFTSDEDDPPSKTWKLIEGTIFDFAKKQKHTNLSPFGWL